jgi:hypothetical protein
MTEAGAGTETDTRSSLFCSSVRVSELTIAETIQRKWIITEGSCDAVIFP